MKVLVFGASGFVGQHLCRFLHKNGHEVIPVSVRNPEWSNQTTTDIDAVVHCIGKAHELKGKSDDSEYYNVNVGLTQQTFQFFVNSNASAYVYLSSIAAIEEEKVDGILDEMATAHPITIYGKTKRQAEEWLLSQTIPADKRMFILRPSLIYGEGDKGNLQLFYALISKGIPYPLGAFDNSRSFLAVSNLTWAIERLIQNDSVVSGIYNIVDDEPISTKDLVLIIGRELNKKPKIWNTPKLVIRSIARIGDYVKKMPLNSLRLTKLTSNYIVSNEKLKAALQITSFPVRSADGVADTIRCFANNKKIVHG